jgi:lanthanide-dependent methanol dehydrogenase
MRSLIDRPRNASGLPWPAAGLILALLVAPALPSAAQSTAPAIVPPPSAAPPDDGQWTMPAKNYASTRYSELAEITADNVKNLQVAFTFSLGVNKGQEAAPLVIGATMYIVTPYPNILYALDLAQPGAPMKWKYEPKPEPA